MNGSDSPHSLTPWLAKFHCYQRAAAVLLAPPLYLLVASLALQVACWLLDILLLKGYAFLTLSATAALVLAGYFLLDLLTKDPLRKEEVFARNEVKLPTMAFLTSLSLIKFFLTPAVDVLGLDLTVAPPVRQASVWKISLTAFWVGLMAVLPYLGPKSILRASLVPLVSNPAVSKVRWLVQNPAALFSPDPHGFAQYPADVGRRFQSPTFTSMVAQALLTIPLSSLVYWTLSSEDQSGMGIVVLLTSMIPLATLQCEIDPKPCLASPGLNRARMVTLARQSVPYAAFAVVVALVVTALTVRIPSIVMCMRLSVTALGLGLYRAVAHDVIAASLLGQDDLRALLVDTDGENMTTLILESIIPRRDVVRQVLEASKDKSEPRALKEMQWVEHTSFEVKIFLISRTKNDVDSLIEGDTLAILLLDQLGGFYATQEASLLKGYVEYAFNRESPYPAPWVVPLVRGLALYCSSMGQALVYIRSKEARAQRRADAWTLPPAFIFSMQCVVQAISTCIVRNIDNEGRPMESYRTSHVVVLVPAAFQALFALHQGLGTFVEDEAVLQLAKLCEACCLNLLNCLKRHKQGMPCPLNPLVQQWTVDCLSRRAAS